MPHPRLHTLPGTVRLIPAAAALAAAALLAGCSGSATPGPTTNVSVQAQATASDPATAAQAAGTPSSTAESSPKQLVAGFPTKLIPLMKGARIESSSLQRSTPLSTATLVSTVTAKPADVLTYYTKVFTDQGFTAQPGNAVDGIPLKKFVRAGGQEIVTVSVVQTGQTSTVTVGANVLPASLK